MLRIFLTVFTILAVFDNLKFLCVTILTILITFLQRNNLYSFHCDLRLLTLVIIGIPSANINMQLKNVNLIFLGRRYSGQLSINPVYKITKIDD